MTVDVRPLARADFPLLGAWLAEPLVARWWHHDPRPAALERDFGPSVDGADPTEMFIATLHGRPFGLIQRYRVEDNPEWGEELSAVWPVPAGALSIDYLIGEPAFRGRGLGAVMIATAVARGWDQYRDADDVVVPVATGNRASWRALETAGFRRVATGELTPDNPVDPRDHVVYRCRRPGGRQAR
jgi:aminoglycoside 6'-N-acetyltransferase